MPAEDESTFARACSGPLDCVRFFRSGLLMILFMLTGWRGRYKWGIWHDISCPESKIDVGIDILPSVSATLFSGKSK